MGSTLFVHSAGSTGGVPSTDFPKAPGLTDYVGKFVADTKYQDIPEHVIELGKKSILDRLGLALAGGRAANRPKRRGEVRDCRLPGGKATPVWAFTESISARPR